MQEVELQHYPEPLIEVPPVAEIEGHTPAGLELLMSVERLLHQDIAEPRRARAEHAAEIAAEEQIGRAASGLQRALGELAVRIAHIGLSGRQLQAEGRAEEIQALSVNAFRAPLPTAENARIAELGEVPRLRQVLAHMVMDVRVV